MPATTTSASAMGLTGLLQEPAVIVAIILGILTATLIAFSRIRGGSKSGGNHRLSVRHFFRGAGENGAGISPYIGMFLIAKRELTHDTILFRFALDKQSNYAKGGGSGGGNGKLVVAGVPPGKHIQIRATIDGEVVNRSYSPVSNDFEEACNGLLDVVVKIYNEAPHPGVMTSKYLNKLSVGDVVEMRGATGMIQYAGNGEFLKSGKPVVAPTFGPSAKSGSKFGGSVGKHIVMIGGGSGVTPCLAILKAIMSSKCPEAVVAHRDHWSQETNPPSSPMTPSVALKEFSKAGVEQGAESRLESIFNVTCAPVFGGKGCTATTPSTDDAVESITFLVCNHTAEDILGREWLQDIAFPSLVAAADGSNNTDNKGVSVLPGGVRFVFFNSRSNAEEKTFMKQMNKDWKSQGFGESSTNVLMYQSGRLTSDAIRQFIPVGNDVNARPFVVLCGPDGLLNDTCKPTLSAMEYTKEQILCV